MTGNDELIKVGRLLSGQPLQTKVIKDKQVGSQEGAKSLLDGVIDSRLCQRSEVDISACKSHVVPGTGSGVAESLCQERLADTYRPDKEDVLVAI